MLQKKRHAADDESTINVKNTEGNVDYLSYNFDEMDLAASWRVLTKQKLNIINGIRLENASWRTWAKQRNNLKTVSPETLNWLKDSDVTWLYGPLHTVMKQDKKHIRPLPSPLQKPQEKPLKSALKKVTMSDLLKRSASELQIHQNNPKKKDDDLSTSSSLSISKVNQEVGAFSPSVIANHRQPKLRFNQYVEQCIALTGKTKNTASDDTDSYEPDDDDDDDNNKDEEEEVIMMKPKLQQKIRSIKKIEPTLLKTSSRSDESSTSSDDEIGDTSYYNYRLRRYNSSHAKQRKNSCDWEAESADSDALVQHIIRVSKDKNTINHASSSNSSSNSNNNSSSSRSNNNNNNNSMIHWNTDDIDQDYIPSKSDYDYEFDDDDWDTHSEHIDDAPSFTEQKKRSNSISSSHTHSTSSSTSSSSSSSILNNIVRWASNHLWSSSDNEDK